MCLSTRLRIETRKMQRYYIDRVQWYSQMRGVLKMSQFICKFVNKTDCASIARLAIIRETLLVIPSVPPLYTVQNEMVAV